MQTLHRSCARLFRSMHRPVSELIESELRISQVEGTGPCSCSNAAQCTLPAFLHQRSNIVQPAIAYRSVSTSACAYQNQINSETRQNWEQLTPHQRKEALKPDKNRNQFKRMWKKDLQIKHTHQTRIKQQAAANAQRDKDRRERWQVAAAMWRGDASTADASQ